MGHSVAVSGFHGGGFGHASFGRLGIGGAGFHHAGVGRPGMGFPVGRGFHRPGHFGRSGFGVGFEHFGRHNNFRFAFGNSCWVNPIFCRGRFGHRFYPWYAGYYPYAYYPYYGFGDYDLDYDYAYPSDSSPQHVATPTSYNEELQASMDALSDQVYELRDEMARERQAAQSRAAANAPAKSEDSTPTVLIFNDGRRMEVQNYGVVGNTLWVFNELRARKYALSELNLQATRSANEERGLTF